MNKAFNNVLLRWTAGRQDTTHLKEFSEDKKFLDFIYLTKLSIVSFQRWFPGSRCVLLYNGTKFYEFVDWFVDASPPLIYPIEYIDQIQLMKTMDNPYKFDPRGVWWKWIPFRLDIDKHEIAIDTDIICINRPQTWYDWLDSDEEILIAPERYEKVLVNTCGDFYSHPILKDKQPFNCGIVGQRLGTDFSKRFFDITDEVALGSTHNSLFITEQGAINVWIRSLEMEGIKHHVLNFEKNAWMRDFIYYLHRGVCVETIHAVTWYKKLIKDFQDIFERKVLDDQYTNESMVQDLMKNAKKSLSHKLFRFLINRQIDSESMQQDFYL